MTKRLTVSLLLLIFVGISGWAENIVTISSASGHPGDEVCVTVSLANSDAVSAFQMDLSLDENLSYVDGSIELSNTRSNGHNIKTVQTATGLRVMIYSLSLTNLKGNNGTLFSFKIKLKSEPYTYELKPDVLLTGANNTKCEVSVESGNITILSPKISVLTEEIDFGNQPIRNTYNRVLTIKNSGNEPLIVTTITVSGTVFSIGQSSISLNSGESTDIDVTFAPTVKGSYQESVSIVSNAVNGTAETTLKACAFTVNEIHVNNVSGSSDSEVDVVVRMNNMEEIAASQMTFLLPEELTYVDGSVKSEQSTHVAYSSFKDNKFTIMLYSPTSKTIPEGECDLLSFKLKLGGSNGIYQLEPTEVVLGNASLENVVSASEGGTVTISSAVISCETEYEFPKTSVNTMAVGRYTVQNTGVELLTITKVVFLDNSFSVAESFPMKIESGESGSFHILHKVNSAEDFSSVMNIYYEDPAERVECINVKGSSYEANNLSAFVSTTDNMNTLHVAMDNFSDIAAVQFDIIFPDGVTCSKDDMSLTNRLSDFSYNIIDKGDRYSVFIYSLLKNVVAENSGELFTLRLHGNQIKQGKIELTNILLSNNNSENIASAKEVSFDMFDTLIGDVNNDGTIDVADVLMLTGVVRGDRTTINDHADVNGDKVVDRADLSALKNILMKK